MIEQAADRRSKAIPLVVDLDRALLRTNLFHELILQFVAHQWFRVWRLLWCRPKTAAELKNRLAVEVDLKPSALPLDTTVLQVIRSAQAHGQPVYIASDSDRRFAEGVAERVGGIAGVFAGEGGASAHSDLRQQQLLDAFGPRGYDYVGSARLDVPVWRHARRVLVAARSRRASSRLAKRLEGAEVLPVKAVGISPYIQAMRPHQWAKNTLLFLPLIAGHHARLDALTSTIIGFLCFCAAASSAYIVNDLLDLPGDRAHPRKMSRPFASGDIPISHGPILSGALMLAAGLMSLLLPVEFMLILGVYVVATLSYSLLLKRKMFIDIAVLGALYTLRVLAGVEAAQVAASQWLLMFSLFLFMSLAIVKRCIELVSRREVGYEKVDGRNYHVSDLSVLNALAAAAGYSAVLVVAFYISSPEVTALYTHPERLWLMQPLLLYWISRTLIMANRNLIHDDPVIFAVTDRISVLCGACLAVIIAASI